MFPVKRAPFPVHDDQRFLILSKDPGGAYSQTTKYDVIKLYPTICRRFKLLTIELGPVKLQPRRIESHNGPVILKYSRKMHGDSHLGQESWYTQMCAKKWAAHCVHTGTMTAQLKWKRKLEANSPQETTLELKSKTVKLEIYMESQCPDTNEFIHSQLMDAYNVLGFSDSIDLTIIPFGRAWCEKKGDDFECVCQHHENECILNQLMNCVIDEIGVPDKYVPVIDCIQGRHNLAYALECLDDDSMLQRNQMAECATGPRGRRLHALAGDKTRDLLLGIQSTELKFVPTIVINGEPVDEALYCLIATLCTYLEPQPKQCSDYFRKVKK